MKCNFCNKETKVDWLDGRDYIICLECREKQEKPYKKYLKKKKEAIKNDPDRIYTKNYLFSTSIVALTAGFFGFIPSMMSVMVFDAPGSQESIMTWIIFLCMFSFTPMCLISILLSWMIYAGQSYNSARLVALLPLINIVVFACFCVVGSLFSF